jgi:hypothetical protein
MLLPVDKLVLEMMRGVDQLILHPGGVDQLILHPGGIDQLIKRVHGPLDHRTGM